MSEATKINMTDPRWIKLITDLAQALVILLGVWALYKELNEVAEGAQKLAEGDAPPYDPEA